MRRVVATVLVSITALLVFASSGWAAGNIVFIFDASGSMWGQINGTPKIAIAKEAMDLIVKDLPGDLNVGLVAYGHRRKGDCDDVETLVQLGPLDADAFLAKVNSLNPKGKTPMVRSIKKTADAIKHLEDETTILLVSDGEETCDPDPCGFVAELEKLGIKFVLHVVGFDVGGQTEEQLKCMAKAGGGEYFPAKDAGKLKEALTTVIKKTVEKNLKVSIFLNGKAIGGSVEVSDPKTGARAGHKMLSVPEPILLGVAPGTYTVTVADEWKQEGRPTLVFENVQINESEVREITANFGSGTLNVWTLRNGKPFNARARLSTLDDQTVGGGYATTYPDKPAQYILQPGQYRLMVEDSWGAGTQKDLGVVEIAAGQTIEKKVSFDTGTLVVWTHRDGKPFHASVIVTDKAGNTMGGGWGTTYPDRPETYVLEPGPYNLEAEDSWGDPVVRLKFGVVEIKAGETLNKICDFDSPPAQSAASPTDAASAMAASGQASTPAASQAAAVAATESPPKQTERETVEQMNSDMVPQRPTNPQNMQAMADQMQATAQAHAAQAQADAMAQMQVAISQMQGNQLAQTQSPAQQAAASGAAARETSLPAGASPSSVDYSNVGAQDTGGGLTEEDERPQQGVNPYEGMSEREIQTAFAQDMSAQGQQGVAYDRTDWKLGKTYPLDCKRFEDTLNSRLNGYADQAQSMGRSDILERIKVARANLGKLAQQRKDRVSKDMLQQTLDHCVQEIHAINVTIAQGQ